MNIKVRLALQFTLIVGGILLFFSALVYYFSYSSQLSKFRQNLLDSARNTATLFINVDEVDSSLLKKIHQSTISFEKEELVLTDSLYRFLYSYNDQLLAEVATLEDITQGDLNYFSIEDKDGVFYRHAFENKHYFVYSMAHDRSRVENLKEMRKILFWSILLSICFSVLLSYIFAKKAIRPISQIIRSVKEINSRKLSSRLTEGKENDEIGLLAKTFNEMLSDLEIAFRNQEDFVSNASHELRTPLTVMIGESDYFLTHEWSEKEYKNHITNTIADLRHLNLLINSLLELAQVNRDKTIPFSDVRIDEILFVAIQKVREKYTGRKILPKIHYPENGNELVISGNSGLLEIACRNLIDNACKFSTEDVVVDFAIKDQTINVEISDNGIGIPFSEINDINKPFKRASNVKFIGGFGLGLSLVSKIMELHKAELKISSRVNKGSRFELIFRRKI